MTVVVPQPVPLEMPTVDPEALEDFVEDVAGTAYRLAVVSTCLTSASAVAPHWQGADASAAAAQVGVVASLADELSGGVAAAAHRLRAHHDRVLDVRQRVAALRSQQDDDFAGAWGRLSRIEDYQLVAMSDGPEAVAVVEDLQAAEAARRREHARLLEDLADDAAATARALGDAGRVLGATGRRGENGVVTAFLAVELPGWGDAELRRRGADLAEALLGRPVAEREALAREAVTYAGSAAFARAFLAGLGEYGVLDLLTVLGDGDLGPTGALPRTLALALGAALPTGGGARAVEEVLTATYIDPDDLTTDPDLVALGMGLVLRAGGAAGPRPETVAHWGRQMLARERTLGDATIETRAVDRVPRIGEAGEPTDPMEIVLQRLTGSDDPSHAAGFLSERSTWDVLLSRAWDDDATALTLLIDHAGTEEGPVGGDAARAGLEALGAGLEDDGDPDGWTVDRNTAAVVSETLGGAVSSHVSLVAGALERAADGQVGPRDGDALRGLGYLTLDAEACRAVEEALRGHVQAAAAAPAVPGPAGAAELSAFVAVREYGQRLDYALHGFEEKAAAQRRAAGWDVATTILTLPSWPARRLGRLLNSDPVGVGLDYAAMVFDCDGVWDNGVDEGLRFDGGDAARATLGAVPHEPREVGVLTARAAAAYDGTREALGVPVPPTPQVRDYIGPLLDLGKPDLPGTKLDDLLPAPDLLPDQREEVNRRIDDLFGN